MNREYLEIEENSAFVKGKISFQKTMKHNLLRKDLHYVNYRSFEHDNVINNVVKTVAIRLMEYTRDAENKKNLKKALMFLDDAKQKRQGEKTGGTGTLSCFCNHYKND